MQLETKRTPTSTAKAETPPIGIRSKIRTMTTTKTTPAPTSWGPPPAGPRPCSGVYTARHWCTSRLQPHGSLWTAMTAFLSPMGLGTIIVCSRFRTGSAATSSPTPSARPWRKGPLASCVTGRMTTSPSGSEWRRRRSRRCCTCGLVNRSYWADFPNKSLICQNHAPGAPTAAASPHGRRTANQTP